MVVSASGPEAHPPSHSPVGPRPTCPHTPQWARGPPALTPPSEPEAHLPHTPRAGGITLHHSISTAALLGSKEQTCAVSTYRESEHTVCPMHMYVVCDCMCVHNQMCQGICTFEGLRLILGFSSLFLPPYYFESRSLNQTKHSPIWLAYILVILVNFLRTFQYILIIFTPTLLLDPFQIYLHLLHKLVFSSSSSSFF